MAPAEQLAPPTPPRLRRPAAVELVLVTILALAILLPGVWRYSLVDPWETHYGEVARRMLQDHDWVHTSWQNEGFRSKPVLTFWAMAASMKALGVADDGGYSGEMVSSARTMLAIRLPFILFGVLGLLAAWWMPAWRGDGSRTCRCSSSAPPPSTSWYRDKGSPTSRWSPR